MPPKSYIRRVRVPHDHHRQADGSKIQQRQCAAGPDVYMTISEIFQFRQIGWTGSTHPAF